MTRRDKLEAAVLLGAVTGLCVLVVAVGVTYGVAGVAIDVLREKLDPRRRR